MTVVTTDDHPGLRLTLELSQRPPAEPEASPAQGGERLRNQESWGRDVDSERSDAIRAPGDDDRRTMTTLGGGRSAERSEAGQAPRACG